MSSSTTVNEEDWLELRGRVEALEANMNGIAWALEQSAAKLQLEVAGPAPAPAGGLVEGVARSMADTPFELPAHGHSWSPEARAAIHHIADWLEQRQDIPIGVSADYFAAMLREEANR